MSSEDLETPDFDGKPFIVGEAEDVWPSRGHGWALLLTVIFTLVAFGSLREGSVMGAIVFFSLAAGVFLLAAVAIRSELRKFMRYRHRL